MNEILVNGLLMIEILVKGYYVICTSSVLKLLSPFDFLRHSFLTLTLGFFCLCYIILDENYTNENTFKTEFIHIFCIKYYITQTKIIKVKFEDKRQ